MTTLGSMRICLQVIVYFLAPAAAGYLLGGATRPLFGRASHPRIATVLVLAALVAAAGGVGPRLRVGFWDSLTLAALFALGWARAQFHAFGRIGWRETLLGGLATVAALGIGEAVLRHQFDFPLGLPRGAEASLFVPKLNLAEPERPASTTADQTIPHLVDSCAYIYPDDFPGHFRERTSRPVPLRNVVLHLGDSMTFGEGIPTHRAFPALLERRAPGVVHVNAAVPGTSVDFHFALALHWIDKLPVRLVVLNLFVNDIAELDSWLPCCNDGPLLDYPASGPVERCPHPQWPAGYGESLRWFVRYSPPPYPIRVAGDFSIFARLVHARFIEASMPKTNWAGREVAFLHLRAILGSLRDRLAARGIPFLVTVLPPRGALEDPDPRRTDGYALVAGMKAACEELRVPVLDPFEFFAGLVRRDGAERYFLPGGDFHFNESGHAQLAEWLAGKLPKPEVASAD